MSNQITMMMMMSLMLGGDRYRVRSGGGTRRLMLGLILICEFQGIAAFYETMPGTWYIRTLGRRLSTAIRRQIMVSRGPKEAYWNSSTSTKALRKLPLPLKTSIAKQIQMISLSCRILQARYLNIQLLKSQRVALIHSIHSSRIHNCNRSRSSCAWASF